MNEKSLKKLLLYFCEHVIDITQVTVSAVLTLISIVSNSVRFILTLYFTASSMYESRVSEFDAQKGKVIKNPEKTSPEV